MVQKQPKIESGGQRESRQVVKQPEPCTSGKWILMITYTGGGTPQPPTSGLKNKIYYPLQSQLEPTEQLRLNPEQRRSPVADRSVEGPRQELSPEECCNSGNLGHERWGKGCHSEPREVGLLCLEELAGTTWPAGLITMELGCTVASTNCDHLQRVKKKLRAGQLLRHMV
ncbi:hypothetical protein B0H13DRAFT_1855957 [Mycena leptocephala]|nr:hypothetical protein B0H13DRAFT_1855957 [Mycena leptocephala]